MVLFRLLQGVFGAALVPLSQAVMLDSYALHERAKAMSIWGMGVMMGPIMGPSLGAWLTETYSWHWVFFVNLPFGIFTVLGLLVFMDETRKDRELRFDWFGFPALAVGIGALQIALDRGEQLGWTESNEIIAEFIVSAVGFYYFFAHSFTTARPFIQFAIFKDRNFVGGCVFMAVMGLVLFSTMALSSPYLQNVIGYPIITAGLLLASRGCGTFVAMMLVGRMMRYIEARTLIISGLSLTCLSLFYMTGWTDQTGVHRDRRRQHRAGIRVRPGVRAAEHGGVPDAAQPSAHRRHLDADPDAQRRQLDRHFHRHRAADRGIAADLRGTVEHVNPFNHAMQMPDVRGMIDMSTDKGRAMMDVMVKAAGADHRVLAGLPDGDDLHAVRDPAGDHDRLHQGRAAQAGAGAGTCGDRVEIGRRGSSPRHSRLVATSARQKFNRRRAAAPVRAAPDSTAAPGRRSSSARGPREWRRRTRGPAARSRSSTRRPWKRRSSLPCR